MDLTFFSKFRMPQRVVVLDIETEGKGTNAVICTIGAVVKDVVTGEEVSDFYVRLETDPQIDMGRTTDKETQDWWLKQREEFPVAFDECFDPDLPRQSLKDGLQLLTYWFDQNFSKKEKPAVFGNGPEFDNVIVDDAFSMVGLPLPWDYWNNQSMRTAVWMGRALLGIDPKKDLEFAGDRHDALNDARHEAEQLHHIFKALLQLKERLHWLTGSAIGESDLQPVIDAADKLPVVYWQSPDVVPEVAKGSAETFWIAVKYLRQGKWETTVFDAQYVNKPLEFAPDDTELEYPLDDDHFVDGNGDPVAALGWHSLLNHPEFSSYYEGISFNDEYVLLGWAKYCKPAFTGKLGG